MPLIPGGMVYPDLPIVARKADIIAALKNKGVLILAGETGSGKTTQLPKMCIDAGFGQRGKIACTQPRRVAAYSVAERIAEECGVILGQEVGFKVRFNDKTVSKTVIKVMTDGMLLTEIQADPLLRQYEVIMIDEVHERSLNIDFLIGYLRQLRIKRPDLKIILTSATIDIGRFSEAFHPVDVIQIEGRMYPVELIYAPVEVNEKGEGGYIEASMQHIVSIVEKGMPGDILVFLPGERDIRELRQALDKGLLNRALILPLMGRLTQAEQHRIFEKSSQRKIILSTNIAETSLTIPGIRFVIDSGFVRLSLYSPQTRTKRLPIQPHSQSSARQRQGRAGRVSEGVCIRLYSEVDFNNRLPYTPPEIQRSNLADVILRMLAFKLGHIESFPFIEPPQERFIKAGYQLLRELGAINEHHQLTPMGHQLANLPIDPTVGRIILEAKNKGVLGIVLVIAAALSIQDPRERPFDEQAKADASHKRFIHPESDFLTLWTIWQAYHDECEDLSQRGLRKFCKSHYLSYIRMREWMDVYDQLKQALKDLHISVNEVVSLDALTYKSIHQSLLAGFISQVGHKERGNVYQVTHNRKVLLFPGSGLFYKHKAGPLDKAAPKDPTDKSKTPQWMMCAEWMETDQLFARTVAKIEPEWVVEMASHVIKKSYLEPYWDAKKGRVLVREKIFLQGLLLMIKAVGYAHINPEGACDIFIREALMPHTILEHFDFLEHNQGIYQEAQSYYHRLRLSGDWELNDRLYDFYAERIKNISSVADLYRYVRSNPPHVLHLSLSYLIDSTKIEQHQMAYPSVALLNKKEYPIDYLHDVNSDDDGAVLKIDVQGALLLSEGFLEGLVPGYHEAYVEAILKALPKDNRRQWPSLALMIKAILNDFKFHKKTRKIVVRDYLKQHYGIDLVDAFWDNITVLPYLLPKVKVFADNGLTGEPIIESRDWKALQFGLSKNLKAVQRDFALSDRGQILWQKACQSFEKENIQASEIGDLPRSMVIGVVNGVEILAYPGFRVEAALVALRLFHEEIEAQREGVLGYRYLLKKALSSDFKLFNKELSVLGRLGMDYMSLGSLDDLKGDILEAIEAEFINIIVPWPIQAAGFREQVNRVAFILRGLPLKIGDQLKSILKIYHSLLQKSTVLGDLISDVRALIYPHFLKYTPFSQWPYLELYLKAIDVRANRRLTNPQKDIERFRLVQPWILAYERLSKTPLTGLKKRKLIHYQWAVEMYKVSVFAQDLKVPESISPKRLEDILGHIEG